MDTNDSIPWKFLIPKKEFGEKFQQCIANGGNSEYDMINNSISRMTPSMLIKIYIWRIVYRGANPKLVQRLCQVH